MNYFTTTAYNTSVRQSSMKQLTTVGKQLRPALDFSMLYGYAETTDTWGRHYGEYGDRPAALGERAYRP